MAGTDLAGKRLEILREIRPSIKTVAFIGVSGASNGATFARETQAAAEKVGMKLLTRLVDSPADLNDSTFESLKRDGAETVIIQPVFTGLRDKVMAMAMKAGLPVIADYLPFAESGALFSFGVDETERVQRLAYFVDRVLKGAKPADLPVEQPTSFKLVVNAKTAKTFGWPISDTFLLRADSVIE
jgi:putative ABC transport system substrate-binding protein